MSLFAKVKQTLIGKPLATHEISHEKLSNPQGLAILASDPLSSTAYATEEILLVLAAVGTVALGYVIPISIAIIVLILVVAFSYRQIIHAYPQGGGAYSVAKDNLGEPVALVAAAALMVDYILTAAVSISAGVAAITSASPVLYPWRVSIALLILLALALGNLRGVRESGKIFSVPTYFFILSMFGLIIYGALRYVTGTFPHTPIPQSTASASSASAGIGAFLILRAFASGCTAMTGLEATSNGVQAFRPPESENAAKTTTWMAIILGIIFIGVSALAYGLHITPKEQETVVSQIAGYFLGRTFPYFLIQAATALILVLAANTPFAGFPRIGSILARDKYFPNQFRTIGSRLVYPSGIVILALIAALLIVFFRADTHSLIPLYAVGVFLVFTISQFSMVRRWRKKEQQGKRGWNICINAFGGALTFVVFAVVFISKFEYGAWMLIPAIFLIILLMLTIRSHYDSVAEQLSLQNPLPRIPQEKTVVVLVAGVHLGTLKAIEFAKTLNPSNLKAVHVSLDPCEAEITRKKWEQYVPDVEIDIVPSPYRDLIGSLIQYIKRVKRQVKSDSVVVVMGEFIPTKFWHHFLHNQTVMQIHWALEHRADVEIVNVPYRLKELPGTKTIGAILGGCWQYSAGAFSRSIFGSVDAIKKLILKSSTKKTMRNP